jgi:hypothetical protein
MSSRRARLTTPSVDKWMRSSNSMVYT